MQRYPPEAVTALARFLARLRLGNRDAASRLVSAALAPIITPTGEIAPDVVDSLLSDTEPPAVAFGGGGSAGTSPLGARGDHTHDGPTNPVTAHEAAADPHPTYTTAAELAAGISAHAAEADPHAGYQRESEKGAANGYASLGADTLVPQDQLGTGTQDGTKFLRDDGTWQAVVTGGRYRAWVYSAFSAGEFTYVVDGSGNPVYALMDLE